MKFGRFEFLVLSAITLLALAITGPAHAAGLLVPVERSEDAAKVAAIAPMPPDWRPIRPPQPGDLPFRVTSSRVDVRIQENIASTTIEQSFLNLTGGNLEVRVMIPLPKGATINKSALSMNDTMVTGNLHTAEEAERIYTSIVQQRRDPALLRFVGENLYEARIFPVPPNEERRLKFTYDTVLAPVNGLYDFRHILAGSQLYPAGIESFSFECVIRSKDSIGPVYSPSHTVTVTRPDEHTAVVKLTQSNLASDRDFNLYYAPSTEDVALRVIAHRPASDEDGYFMLVGRPDDELAKARILPKEIVFVLDTSGSMMQEKKMDQAQKALTFCLGQLNEKDRFNLVTFSTDVRTLSPQKLLDATKENVGKAIKAVELLEATGGTNIDGALREALANDFSEGKGKAKLVIFLTDGLPSVGITDIPEILKDVAGANTHGARIFNFGVGTDVNTHLLDKIASDYDGASSYVAPKEDLELKLSDFYGKIRNPVMTDLAFDFGPDARAHSMYPRRIPALFKGSEILAFGRYKGAGSGPVTLTGYIGGEQRTIKIDVAWPDKEADNGFLPRVWAMRKIGHLLEDVRLHGPNKETIDEIVALSQQHGIVTPYTSQLVLEPGMQPVDPLTGGRFRGGEGDRANLKGAERREALRRDLADRLAADAPAAEPAAAAKAMASAEGEAKTEAKKVAQDAQTRQSGGMAVGLSEFEERFKEARSLDPAGDTGLEVAADGKKDKNADAARRLRNQAFLAGGKGSAGPASAGEGGEKAAEEMADALAVAQELTIKHAAGHTFYLRHGVWIDSTFKHDEKAEPKKIETFSKEYFQLLTKNPKLGAVMALGGTILVVVDGQAYQIEPAKKDAAGAPKAK